MKIEYLLIKTRNDFCQTIEQFKNLLSSNSRISFSNNTLLFKETVFNIIITSRTIEKDNKNKPEIIFYFQISYEKANNTIAGILGDFDDLLRRINSQCGEQFIINTIWDDVSMYYTNELYPKIIEIENLLRKIIYKLMINTNGSGWFRSYVPLEVKESINKTLEKNQKSQNELIGDQLYYADFIQLSWFFFSKYSLKVLDQTAVLKMQSLLIDKKEKLDATDKVEALLDDLVAKSNWERFFSDKIQVDDLSSKWEKLYGYRNQVAHAKRMKRGEFEDATSIIAELKPAFERCLDEIDNVIVQAFPNSPILHVGMSKALQLMVEAITSTVNREKIESNLINTASIFSSALNLASKEFVFLSSGVEAIQQYRDNVHDIMEEIGAIAHCDAHDDYWYNTGKYSDDEALKAVLKEIKNNPIYTALNDRDQIASAVEYTLEDVAYENDCPFCQKAYDE